MSPSRHRSVLVALLLVVTATFALVVASPGGVRPASAASVAPTASCRALDPNLVHGVCLKYTSRSGTGFSWIGTLRADNGRVFFCIDYLYDSRIAGNATVIGTHGLVNQFGSRVGAAEVAALNEVISTWAAHGSTGSDNRDAAIGLIIREVMSDGTRSDGTVVYPRGLRVGGTVRAPVGGLSGPVLDLARSMWSQGSAQRGPWRVSLTASRAGALPLGTTRTYRTTVVSSANQVVPGARVTFTCTGPISCPAPLRTTAAGSTVAVRPAAIGAYSIRATVTGPAADGKLYRVGTWRTHGGGGARNNGVQRGWIAQSTPASATVSATSGIVKGNPQVATRASVATVVPGTPLRDLVTVSSLPAGYEQTATATLYGPFDAEPGATSCTPDRIAGRVSFPLVANGSLTTPAVVATQPGYYVWTESLPGDVHTNPVTAPCGLSVETTLVRSAPLTATTPRVHTIASGQHSLVGGRVYDDVRVDGLPSGASVPVEWTLLGPIAPRQGSCAGLDWSHAPVIARGSLVVSHDGTWRTAPTVLRTAGCVTYTERLLASSTSVAVSTRPGVASETVLVTRPVTRVVPEIPSGPFSDGTR
ncbi:MAG: Sortase family protein [Marmoricola sp.]|nr:Sortase family protein [Marmoricola sp.]